jgi:hypothetical protein
MKEDTDSLTSILLDSLTNQLGTSSFTLSTNFSGLFLLNGLIDQEGSTLSGLLSDLFAFHRLTESRREGDMCDRDIV